MKTKLHWLAALLLGASLNVYAQDPAQDTPDDVETRKGKLDVLRYHDSIEIYFAGRYRLVTDNPLPLAALHGHSVELQIRELDQRNGQTNAPERAQAKLAEVVTAVNPQPWSGAGVIRKTADGLELMNPDGLMRIVGLHAGLQNKVVDKYLQGSGWVFADKTLVLSSAMARIVVQVDKGGNASEDAYLNERTVDGNGVATYGDRDYLEPGTMVEVFDIAAYRRAERDDKGNITKPGIWRPSLADMVGPDILMARVSLSRRDEPALSGWIPARKLELGEIPPQEFQQGLADMLAQTPAPAAGSGEPLPPAKTVAAPKLRTAPPSDEIDRDAQGSVPEQRRVNLPLGDNN